MADAGDLKSPACNGRAGSSPAFAMFERRRHDWRRLFLCPNNLHS